MGFVSTLDGRCASRDGRRLARTRLPLCTIAESLRLGSGPAAIVLPSANRSVVIGVLVADELYGRPVPVLVVPGDAHASLRTGEAVTIATGGRIT